MQFRDVHYFYVACSLSLPVSAPHRDSSCSKTDSRWWTSGPYTTQAQAPPTERSNSPIFCWQENCCWCIPLSVLLRFPQQCSGKQSFTKPCHAVYVRRPVAVHILNHGNLACAYLPQSHAALITCDNAPCKASIKTSRLSDIVNSTSHAGYHLDIFSNSFSVFT